MISKIKLFSSLSYMFGLLILFNIIPSKLKTTVCDHRRRFALQRALLDLILFMAIGHIKERLSNYINHLLEISKRK